jgi:hypothetical protein
MSLMLIPASAVIADKEEQEWTPSIGGNNQARHSTAGPLSTLTWPWIISPEVMPSTNITGAGYCVGSPRIQILKFISYSIEQKPNAEPLIKLYL